MKRVISFIVVLFPLFIANASAANLMEVESVATAVNELERNQEQVRSMLSGGSVEQAIEFLSSDSMSFDRGTEALVVAIGKNVTQPNLRLRILQAARDLSNRQGMRTRNMNELAIVYLNDHSKGNLYPEQGEHRAERISAATIRAMYEFRGLGDEDNTSDKVEHLRLLKQHAAHVKEKAGEKGYLDSMEAELLMRGFKEHSEGLPQETINAMADFALANENLAYQGLQAIFDVCKEAIRKKEDQRNLLEACRSEATTEKLREIGTAYTNFPEVTGQFGSYGEQALKLLAEIEADRINDSVDEILRKAIATLWNDWAGNGSLSGARISARLNLKEIFSQALYGKSATELNVEEIDIVLRTIQLGGGADYLSAIDSALGRQDGLTGELRDRIVLKAALNRIEIVTGNRQPSMRDAKERIHRAIAGN